MWAVFVLTAVVLVGINAEILKLGDECANGEGFCSHMHECPGVEDDIKKGAKFPICCFLNEKPIICCPSGRMNLTSSYHFPDLGHPCQGGEGFCARVADCPGADAYMANGWRPEICRYWFGSLVICCPAKPLKDFSATTVAKPTSEYRPSPIYRPLATPAPKPQTNNNGSPVAQVGKPQEQHQMYPSPQGEARPVWPSGNSVKRNSTWSANGDRPKESVATFRPPASSKPNCIKEFRTLNGWRLPIEVRADNGELCRENNIAEPLKVPPTSSPTIPPFNPNRPLVSPQKCKEYGEYVYKNITKLTRAGVKEIKRVAFCTELNPQVVVVNGLEAEPREYPHMARIGYDGKSKIIWGCGGSLISERYILSAAHCTKLSGSLVKWALIGDLDTTTDKDDADPITVRIVERYNYPEFTINNGVPFHDIAVYKLERNIPLGIYIRPICLNAEKNHTAKTGMVTGWGRTKYGGRESPILRKAHLKLKSNEQCKEAHPLLDNALPNGIHPDWLICAGGHDEKDTCNGDSGGPLQVFQQDPYCTWSIIGITSFGEGCGTNVPGIYTKVANYVPWIESIVWPQK